MYVTIPLLNLYAHTRVHRIYLILFGIAIFYGAHTYTLDLRVKCFEIRHVFTFTLPVDTGIITVSNVLPKETERGMLNGSHVPGTWFLDADDRTDEPCRRYDTDGAHFLRPNRFICYSWLFEINRTHIYPFVLGIHGHRIFGLYILVRFQALDIRAEAARRNAAVYMTAAFLKLYSE
jgi:hypothetical protein